jgi:hypothetical protein
MSELFWKMQLCSQQLHNSNFLGPFCKCMNIIHSLFIQGMLQYFFGHEYDSWADNFDK